MSFMIETSARHIHLTQETVEKLFGKGYELTIRKPLSYPGQYACNERLTIVGPKKEMANVSILGPVRKADQVEVSATDARTLGIDAPVRESGDVKGSGACKLIGHRLPLYHRHGRRLPRMEHREDGQRQVLLSGCYMG